MLAAQTQSVTVPEQSLQALSILSLTSNPDRPHHVAAVPGMGVNPVASVPDQVGIDVTLSPFLSANLPPDNHRLSHCFVSYQH